MKTVVKLACDAVTTLARAALGSGIAAIVLITLAAVWWRYVLNSPISWIEQVSTMIFVWVIFIGAAVLYRQNLHIGVEMFLQRLPERAKPVWKWVIEIGNLIFIVVMLIFSAKLTIDVLPNTYGALEISPAFVYASAPISSAMMLLFFIEKLVDPAAREPVGEVGDF